MLSDEIWLSITEYSTYRNISVSTIRRYIKRGQVKYKQEQGKYFIFVSQDNYQKRGEQKKQQDFELRLSIEKLQGKIKALEEENNDLKMLVQLYEGKKLIHPPITS